MTTHTSILDLSSDVIDSGRTDVATNRVTNQLSELTTDVALVESFSHMVALRTGEGLVLFDSSSPMYGEAVVTALRRWSADRVHTLVYTHGHLDHVGGSGHLAADASDWGHPPMRVVAQNNLAHRFERYRRTSGWNQAINLRQFGGLPPSIARDDKRMHRPFLPSRTLEPTTSYDDVLTESIGGYTFEHHHALGETDDHTWTWVPELKLITAGDQLTWVFPNCGNPQKVQRYPLEWARSLRAMATKGPELLVPAHGLPISGRERIERVLTTVAGVLEHLVDQVLEAMNSGAALDEVLNTVNLAPEELALPFLQPVYDEPEFVVRNVWRLYGGWWDGEPSTLKPPSADALAVEVAALAGGAAALAERAGVVADEGDLRLACRLIDFAARAEPSSKEVHERRAGIYARRRIEERSLMAKGIFGSAAAESEMVWKGEASLKPARVSLGEAP